MTLHRSILLVDDHLYIRRMLSETLILARYHVIPAATAEEALDAFHTQSVDLILTDLHLAGPSGFALASTIRRSGGRGARIPILGMTADPDLETGRICEQAGLTAMIGKPFSLDAFRAVVARALAI